MERATDPQEFHKFSGGYDVAFPCDLCGEIFRGPGPLEAHILEKHTVPVEQSNGVPLPEAVGAVPATRRGRPRRVRSEG